MLSLWPNDLIIEMKKKKKAYDPIKLAKAIRRDLEIQEHGKQISFRTGSTFKSKKDYKRNKKVNIDEDF